MIIQEPSKNVPMHSGQTNVHALNQHQISHKLKGKAASPTLNRLANHNVIDSTALPRGAEQ
ncbi:hypothetical protein [Marinobacter sp. AC-23]|uniref:hypothetical protein n=1 Tax=Marinobacter sp. AC-23 TaxID=1879031 RepID=UPI0008DE55C4|nr:hypothetical protein [Marinobacter sp. AC-23]OHY82737.1 hypothetical protein BCA33_00485 [Marinobacter sp. AC-23]